jgi:hypothetical protein
MIRRDRRHVDSPRLDSRTPSGDGSSRTIACGTAHGLRSGRTMALKVASSRGRSSAPAWRGDASARLRRFLVLCALVGCGGRTAPVGEVGAGDDASGLDAAVDASMGRDGSPTGDAGAADEGEPFDGAMYAEDACTPYTDALWNNGDCGTSCPAGTMCVRRQVPSGAIDVGCAPLPAECDGQGSCACMSCVCVPDLCSIFNGGLLCGP